MHIHKSWWKRKGINHSLHLWVGLVSSLVLFVVCLTGTILAFQDEITHFFIAEVYEVEIPENGKLLTLDEITKGLEDKYHVRATEIYMPSDRNKTWSFKTRPIESENTGKGKQRGKRFYVNPYTGEANTLEKSGINSFFSTMVSLHRSLLMNNTGKLIVGIFTIILIGLEITGLILWWPKHMRKWKQWAKGFIIKTSAHWKRVNYDLHNTLGFYSIIFILIMCLTGLSWSFNWYREGVKAVVGAPLFRVKGQKSLPLEIDSTKQKRLPMADLVNITHATFEGEGDVELRFSNDEYATVRVRKYNPDGFFASPGTNRMHINPYTVETYKVEHFAALPLKVKILDLNRSLHTGDIFGTSSKIIYFISCLIATSLPVTGFIVWFGKLRKKKAKQNSNRKTHIKTKSTSAKIPKVRVKINTHTERFTSDNSKF